MNLDLFTKTLYATIIPSGISDEEQAKIYQPLFNVVQNIMPGVLYGPGCVGEGF